MTFFLGSILTGRVEYVEIRSSGSDLLAESSSVPSGVDGIVGIYFHTPAVEQCAGKGLQPGVLKGKDVVESVVVWREDIGYAVGEVAGLIDLKAVGHRVHTGIVKGHQHD